MSETYCTVCDVNFSTVHSLQTHLKSNKHHKKANNIVGFPCECGKTYRSRQNRHNHRVKCNVYQEFKKKKLANSTTATTTTTTLSTVENLDNNRILELEKDAQIKDLQHENENLQHENEKLKYKLEIAQLKEKIANTTKVTNNYKTINNIITINAFGEEKIDYITDEKKIKYCKENYKCLKTYLNDVHFNPNHPENHNIKLQNKKEKMCLIMENNKWNHIPKDMLYLKMKMAAYDALKETYNKYKSKFDPRKQSRFEEFVKKYEEEDKKLNKDLDKDFDVLFLEAKNNLK